MLDVVIMQATSAKGHPFYRKPPQPEWKENLNTENCGIFVYNDVYNNPAISIELVPRSVYEDDPPDGEISTFYVLDDPPDGGPEFGTDSAHMTVTIEEEKDIPSASSTVTLTHAQANKHRKKAW